MRRPFNPLLLGLLFAFAPAWAATPAQQAQDLIQQLQAGQFEPASAGFAPALAQALTPAKLASAWGELQQQLGPLQRSGQAEIQAQAQATLVKLPLYFEKGQVLAQVTVDAQGQVSHLQISPDRAPPSAPTGNERAFQVAGLPGILTLPNGPGPFPAVVLVPGSGPNDRDETIGPNKPFRDLAQGLAERGIAVLRYDKRSFADPASLAGARLTMDAETTNDAVAAVAALAATAGIDPRHVYVMGHSQGGLLAPRIAQRSGKVAGIVLWAAPARHLLDLYIDQNRYQLGLDGSLSDEDRAALALLDRQVGQLRAGQDVAIAGLPAPAGYLREFDRIDPIAELAPLPLPVLWLQGQRDIQVTSPDWALWQAALAGNPRATLHAYPALNHLGLAGTGPGTPAEYMTPGHVDTALVADTAVWIHAQP